MLRRPSKDSLTSILLVHPKNQRRRTRRRSSALGNKSESMRLCYVSMSKKLKLELVIRTRKSEELNGKHNVK
jgi:hypothetical protein